MHPVLIKFGEFAIYTYGFFIAVGFLAGIYLAKREAGRVGVNADAVVDLSFYIILSALIGSRVFYVFTNPDVFRENPMEVFKLWNGGLVFYGGFIFALITAFITIRIKKLDLWKIADIIAPAIPIGQFFGRLGCFFAGCCYGKSCELPWAVTFSNPESLAPTGIPVHPTQLYHALGSLLVFSVLWLYRTRKKFDGQLFWMYVAGYGAVRAFLEIFRGDDRGDFYFNGLLSISQVIGILMVLLGTAMLILLRRRKQSVPS